MIILLGLEHTDLCLPFSNLYDLDHPHHHLCISSLSNHPHPKIRMMIGMF